MLRQRIVTAIVLVPPLVAALFLLPSIGVVVLFGVFIAAAAWEWATLCGLASAVRLGYVALVIALGAILLALGRSHEGVVRAVNGIATLWWLWALVELRWRTSGIYESASGRLAIGLLTLVPAWIALAALYDVDAHRPLLLLYVLVLVAVADTAAYAAGHAFGRTKLAPSISPGKTVEGVVGGVVGVVLLSFFCGTMLWHFEGGAVAGWIALAAIAGLISVIGDLSESKLKRIAGVKDSGALLPGHGGMLDRIDALTAAAPTFAWGWLIWFDVHP